MKLEHLPNANVNDSGDDLIRLFDFTVSEVKALINVIRTGLIANEKSIQLELLDFIHPLNCTLVLALSETYSGIRKNAYADFAWSLTREGFQRMIELIEPFAEEDATGYRWLFDLPAESARTEFLFSINGKW